MLIEIHTFSFQKIHLKMSSGKWRPFCLGLNVLSIGSDNDLSSAPLKPLLEPMVTYWQVDLYVK